MDEWYVGVWMIKRYDKINKWMIWLVSAPEQSGSEYIATGFTTQYFATGFTTKILFLSFLKKCLQFQKN